jgi:hypothetical protein
LRYPLSQSEEIKKSTNIVRRRAGSVKKREEKEKEV